MLHTTAQNMRGSCGRRLDGMAPAGLGGVRHTVGAYAKAWGIYFPFGLATARVLPTGKSTERGVVAAIGGTSAGRLTLDILAASWLASGLIVSGRKYPTGPRRCALIAPGCCILHKRGA
jgi:hypothetical protein